MAKPLTPDQVRAKYLRALEQGKTYAQATEIANGMANKPIKPDNPVPKPPQSLVDKIAGNQVYDPRPDEKGKPVTFPPDWREWHWKKREGLALEIVGGKGPLVPAKGQTRAQKADAIIAAESEARTA